MSEIFTLGIDVGSTASKCIILKDGKEIVVKSLIDVGAGTGRTMIYSQYTFVQKRR